MALFAVNSMLKDRARTYLPPNSQSMQKTIEGAIRNSALQNGMQFLYKGGYSFRERLSVNRVHNLPVFIEVV